MIIVADESVDKQIVERLRFEGHQVEYVAELNPGIDDEAVLQLSRTINALLITGDKDFGELVFRDHRRHSGVLLIRLEGLSAQRKAELVAMAIEFHGEEMCHGFSVLAERSLRLRPLR